MVKDVSEYKGVYTVSDDFIAECLGWTAIKSWGGRGRRGVPPWSKNGRHESVPSYGWESGLGSLLSAIAQRHDLSYNVFILFDTEEREYVASVNGNTGCHKKASQALAQAFILSRGVSLRNAARSSR